MLMVFIYCILSLLVFNSIIELVLSAPRHAKIKGKYYHNKKEIN